MMPFDLIRCAWLRWVGALLLAAVAGLPAFAQPGEPASASPAVVYSVVLTPRPAGATLALELSREVDYDITVLRQPDRIVIDLPKVVFATAAQKPAGKVGPVAAYRYGLFFADRSRVVIDLAEPALNDRVDSIEVQGRRRLLFHIGRADRNRFAAAATDSARNRADSAVAAAPASVGSVAPSGKRPLVVIDPGHGGIDPGATTASGEAEKTVVLALALALRQQLEKSGKVEVAMTRDGDTFIALRDRVRFARERGAALLLSLHADTLAYEPGVRGASIYTLSEKASDEISQRLADSENKADQVAGLDLPEDESQVGNVLFDLTKRETRHFSIQLARQLAETLPKTTSMHKNPLRSAGFRVLTAPDVPSALVEVGYLSSAEDVKRMLSADWRGGMAEAIAAAVEKYVGENATAMTNSGIKP